MKLIKQCLLLVILSSFNAATAEIDSPCSDWAQYKDEKCFKILDDTFRSYADAVAACSALDHSPKLPVIHSQDEQAFLTNYLFKMSKKVDNFWLGAKVVHSKFFWFDNSTLTFTNWVGSPRNKANYCVQMQADEAQVGKWIDEPCKRKNLVVCQKEPIWTMAHLQQTLVATRKELRDSLKHAQQEISTLKNKAHSDLQKSLKSATSQLKASLLPLGFIYVQLPYTAEPSTIWSDMNWTEVTSTYAGVFFRVAGGKAASFGAVQQDQSPMITAVKYADCEDSQEFSKEIEIGAGWSKSVLSGIFGRGKLRNCNQFYRTNGETRPWNMAVRVWKRSA